MSMRTAAAGLSRALAAPRPCSVSVEFPLPNGRADTSNPADHRPVSLTKCPMTHSPLRPDAYDWESHYPEFFAKHREETNKNGDVSTTQEPPLVRFADVGCGFGGLLVRLSPLFPNDLAVGMEIRDKVSQYVKERCVALRKESPGSFENISCIRTNSMKYLPNFFKKAQLTKLFFLFPDPHFKTANHRRRIIQRSLLSEYAYTLAVGGVMYTITDVEVRNIPTHHAPPL